MVNTAFACQFSWGCTLVSEVFLDFSWRKRSRASREAATTSLESHEEREKNLWLPWPRISLHADDSCQTRQIANKKSEQRQFSKHVLTSRYFFNWG